jgi:hypothetical protein
MPPPSKRRFWSITGWDSLKEIYSRRVPYGSISEQRLRALLAALAAKHGLTDDEIVDSYLNPKAKGHRALLDVQLDSGSSYVLSCGDNPHFTARVVHG